MLLDGGFTINIIIKQLGLRLGLPKPKPAPYNMKMVYQTTTKPMGLIEDLKICVHGIPYITMFTVFHNNVVDFSYSMVEGMLKWHMIGGVTLLPYKGMGQLEQLQSPSIWEVK